MIIPKIKALYQALSLLGCDRHTHLLIKRQQIMLTNKIALVCILNSFPYFFIFQYFDLLIPSYIVLPTTSSYILCLYLNYKQYFKRQN